MRCPGGRSAIRCRGIVFQSTDCIYQSHSSLCCR